MSTRGTTLVPRRGAEPGIPSGAFHHRSRRHGSHPQDAGLLGVRRASSSSWRRPSVWREVSRVPNVLGWLQRRGVAPRPPSAPPRPEDRCSTISTAGGRNRRARRERCAARGHAQPYPSGRGHTHRGACVWSPPVRAELEPAVPLAPRAPECRKTTSLPHRGRRCDTLWDLAVPQRSLPVHGEFSCPGMAPAPMRFLPLRCQRGTRPSPSHGQVTLSRTSLRTRLHNRETAPQSSISTQNQAVRTAPHSTDPDLIRPGCAWTCRPGRGAPSGLLQHRADRQGRHPPRGRS